LPPIRATQEQFQQIVLNLVSNAADAMRPHGGVLTIELRRLADSPSSGGHRSSHLAGDCVRLRVADTGCGIPAEVLPRVFEPFFTTKPVDAGTGMGLAIVHGIVQELQGDIRIESEAGKGTVVEVCFPAVESATGDLRVQRPADSTYRENEDRLPDAGRAPGGRRNAES
jgi:signal transduction histidine kinase